MTRRVAAPSEPCLSADARRWRVAVGVHVHAEPAHLRATLSSLRANTSRRVSLILLPDGPDAETAAALSTMRHIMQSGTDQPCGAAACFNRLASSVDADVVILVESGVLLGPRWLDHLLAALSAETANGLAGPSTNRAWNEQSLIVQAADSIAEVARAAGAAERKFGPSWRPLTPLHSLCDFCYAVRRDVLLAIGEAEEGYGLGPCWEMDYNIRAARAGFTGVWACSSYVHRLPPTARQQREEGARFEASKRLYQDKFCGLRLRGENGPYEPHCRGDACAEFAPLALIPLRRPWRDAERLTRPVPARTPAPSRRVARSAGTENRLVSCVMPTRGRNAFALQAIDYFRRQDYPERELIVLHDDDENDLSPRLPDDPSVRYVRMAAGQSIGSKRNRGCELARGAFIAQWDDDDWYAPGRLSAQLAPLLAGAADVTALRADIFFDLDRWRFWGCTPELHRQLFVHDVHGGTLVYRRDVWERMARYPDLSLAEDAAFLRGSVAQSARLTRLRDSALFMYLRHGRNSWSFTCGRHVDPSGWVRLDEPPLPAPDRAFYLERREAAASTPGGSRRALPTPTTQVLVSCIMPTANRRRFVPRAIDYFLRQDYAARELIVVDDGEDPVEDLMPADHRIRYVRLENKLVTGAKRNVACELARGEIIAHWDDDDWMADHRLSYQVRALVARPGAEACGLTRVLFYEPRSGGAWEYVYPEGRDGWVAGNTLCYRRSAWQGRRFPEIQEGEDTRFVDAVPPDAIIALDDNTFFVGMIHAGNTSPKQTHDSRWRRRAANEVLELMRSDRTFYETVR